MPLPDDQRVVALAEDLLQQFDTIFGLHPGFRAAHAKGILLDGTFTPTSEAASLSRAIHFNQPLTPVLVRFSNSTGLPALPDNDPNADPRGMAVRFVLGEHKHTDIVSHTVDAFPARDGYEFLEMLRAVSSGDQSRMVEFMGSHPAAARFVQTPKPAPVSFATATYFAVTAIRFTNSAGESNYGRYRIVPENGNEVLDADTLSKKGPGYLIEEVKERIANKPARFNILLQVAAESDTVDDATVHWPDNRPIVELGSLQLTKVTDNNAAEQKRVIFDPIPRLDGIEPSADPWLELRAAIYLLSGRRRRSA